MELNIDKQSDESVNDEDEEQYVFKPSYSAGSMFIEMYNHNDEQIFDPEIDLFVNPEETKSSENVPNKLIYSGMIILKNTS